MAELTLQVSFEHFMGSEKAEYSYSTWVEFRNIMERVRRFLSFVEKFDSANCDMVCISYVNQNWRIVRLEVNAAIPD